VPPVVGSVHKEIYGILASANWANLADVFTNCINESEASYFVFTGQITNQAYSMEKETINLYTKSGKVIDVANASDQFNLKALSKKVIKNYMCFPKTN
jgi:hypothetical protein